MESLHWNGLTDEGIESCCGYSQSKLLHSRNREKDVCAVSTQVTWCIQDIL